MYIMSLKSFSVSYREQDSMDLEDNEAAACQGALSTSLSSGSDFEMETMAGIAKVNSAMSLLDRKWKDIPNTIPSSQLKAVAKMCNKLVLGHLGITDDPQEPLGKQSSIVKEIIQISSEVDPQTRTQLLSLVVGNYTVTELKALCPDDINRRRFTEARRHAALVGPGLPVNKPKIIRETMQQHKIVHFVEFVTMPVYTQMVAVGTKSMTLSSGEDVLKPYVIRNQRNSEIIKAYLQFCVREHFKPLCERSLYKILECCPASRRKSKKCLDNFQADGEEGFNTLEEVCYRLSAENLIGPLRAARQHLQGSYATHVTKESKVADHCITYSLSDKKTDGSFSKACGHERNETCATCSRMYKTLQSMKSLLEKARKGPQDVESRSKIYDGEVALGKIHQWRQHVVRTVNQQLSKTEFLHNIKANQVFLIQDWAMKFLATKFLEGQADWFSKRGTHLYNYLYATVSTKRKYTLAPKAGTKKPGGLE